MGCICPPGVDIDCRNCGPCLRNSLAQRTTSANDCLQWRTQGVEFWMGEGLGALYRHCTH